MALRAWGGRLKSKNKQVFVIGKLEFSQAQKTKEHEAKFAAMSAEERDKHRYKKRILAAKAARERYCTMIGQCNLIRGKSKGDDAWLKDQVWQHKTETSRLELGF